jgi:hypothetical protein
MRTCVALGLTTLLCTAAVPAFADWDHVGTVTFSMRDNHDSTYADFRGDRVALTSRNSDVYCRDVEATFGNGRTRTLFSGMIPQGQTVNVDLPGGDRNVDRLDFDCRPMNGWRARVDVAANVADERFGYEPNYSERYTYNNGSRYDNPAQSFFGHLFGR